MSNGCRVEVSEGRRKERCEDGKRDGGVVGLDEGGRDEGVILHLHPDLRRVGEHGGFGQSVGLVSEVFRDIILPVLRNAYRNSSLVKFG